MQYKLLFKLRYRCNGKVKTRTELLYEGGSYAELTRIEYKTVIAGLHSVSASRNGDELTVTITENNVD